MNKIKLGVIFGGMSTENEVSVISGTSILKELDKEKYELFPIYIDKKGKWYKYLDNIEESKNKVGDKIEKKEEIENIIKYLQKLDIVFPVLHGLYGEDGTIQGLLELLKIPYVGCKVLASSIGMDKVYAKIIFKKANINQVKCEYVKKVQDGYVYVKGNFIEEKLTLEEICKKISQNIKFPMFIKPSNSGSSVGITKADNEEGLKESIIYAGKYDNKILIEQEIKGKEVECAILGNEETIASTVGQIKAADKFYSYDAKYNNSESKTVIPAELSEEKIEEIRKISVKAFKAIDGKGLARVDFFVEDKTEDVYINEINTLPGFTPISMYPKLFEASGIPYSELLDKIIELAIL